MKLKENFVTHDMDNEQVMVDVSGDFSGLVKSNRTAAFVVEFLKEEHTREEIIEAMYDKYEAPKEVIEKDVDQLLQKLADIGALSE